MMPNATVLDHSHLLELPELAPHPDTGVAFTKPPASIFRDAMEQIAIATEGFEPGDAAILGISTNAGWNAAIVAKTKGGIELHAWIGSSWGEKLDYGVIVRKKFKLGF